MNINLCKYKNALGEPNKGIHSYRFLGVAIADVIMTILGALLIAYIFHVSFLKTLVILFVLGIFLHHLFCVRTTVDKWIFE